MSGKVYEADGPIIRKLPVETKTETGVKISIGFPVCRLTEWCDDQGEAVAEIMNRGEAYDFSQAEIERLRKALREMVYETTHLSPVQDDGSHWAKISGSALAQARAALDGGKE